MQLFREKGQRKLLLMVNFNDGSCLPRVEFKNYSSISHVYNKFVGWINNNMVGSISINGYKNAFIKDTQSGEILARWEAGRRVK